MSIEEAYAKHDEKELKEARAEPKDHTFAYESEQSEIAELIINQTNELIGRFSELTKEVFYTSYNRGFVEERKYRAKLGTAIEELHERLNDNYRDVVQNHIQNFRIWNNFLIKKLGQVIQIQSRRDN